MMNNLDRYMYNAKFYESSIPSGTKDSYIEKDNIEYRGFAITNVVNKWSKFKFVFDATNKTGTKALDTFRMYIDGLIKPFDS